MASDDIKKCLKCGSLMDSEIDVVKNCVLYHCPNGCGDTVGGKLTEKEPIIIEEENKECICYTCNNFMEVQSISNTRVFCRINMSLFDNINLVKETPTVLKCTLHSKKYVHGGMNKKSTKNV